MSQLDELFPPKPGGAVHTARQRAMAEQAQASNIPEGDAYGPAKVEVPVSERGTEFARARTFSVATGNPTPQLLGQDLNRRYAVIMTLDEPVVIAFSEQQAQDPQNAVNAAGLPANGFVLPTGVPVPVNSTSVIYAAAMSATPTRVSVMSFSYAAPDAA